jgi:hypothetical protein
VEGDVGSTTGLQFWKRDREGEQDSSLVETEEQEISFHVGPFNNRGHCFIEVSGFTFLIIKQKTIPSQLACIG